MSNSDGIALLEHAAPVGNDEDEEPDRFGALPSGESSWETAWMVTKTATALSTPKALPVRFGSSSTSSGPKVPGSTPLPTTPSRAQAIATGTDVQLPDSAESSKGVEDHVSLVLGRNSHVELDLVVAHAGRYYFGFDLKKHEIKPSTRRMGLTSNCCSLAACFPSTEVVWVTVQLYTLDHLGNDHSFLRPSIRTKNVAKAALNQPGAAGAGGSSLHGPDVRVTTQFSLSRTESHGQFKFDVTDSTQHYRLRATLSTGRFNINNPKEVFVKLNRRKIPNDEYRKTDGASEVRNAPASQAQIGKQASSSLPTTSNASVGLPLFSPEAFSRFVSYVGYGLSRHHTRLRHAGSETFHDVSNILGTGLPQGDFIEKVSMIPLRTKRDGFFEDLTAVEYFQHKLQQSDGSNHNKEEVDAVWKKPVVYGRNVILRGVNLAGITKLPIGQATELPERFERVKDPEYCRSEITFVGRPFPIEDADDHFARIVRWGFNCLRFLITWEAIEHGGPGEHDEAYLDYVEQVVKKAGEHGLYVFIDPHQDVWSRFTGGSGAPAWTLELCGLDVTKLQGSHASFTHYASSPDDPTAYRKMTWPQNYQRFAALHMFALFFAGKQFAPEFTVAEDWTPGRNPEEVRPGEGVRVNVQEFMQSRFLESIRQVAIRMDKFPHVLGFDTFNEPSSGFVGKKLDQIPERVIPPGRVFRPIDAMVCAAGLSTKIKIANGIGLLTSSEVINSERVSAWLPGRSDIWQRQGVWRRGTPSSTRSNANNNNDSGSNLVNKEEEVQDKFELLRPNYFVMKADGSKFNFFKDFLLPFAQSYQRMLREIRPSFMIFLEGDAFGHDDFYWPSSDQSGGVVNATHWYDGITLFMRRFNPSVSIDVQTNWPVIGRSNVRNMHVKALSHIKSLPKDPQSNSTRVVMPTLIGEFGCPFDLNDSIGLKTGDFSAHTEALSSYYAIFDQLMLSSALWNYSPVNSNTFGDHWNLENLSIFSPEQRSNPSDPDSGARALRGFSRPYAPCVAGTRLTVQFDHQTRVFLFRYFPSKANFECGDPLACTVLYLPDCHYFDSLGIGESGAIARLNVKVRNATYVLEKLPGRHIMYVWATPGTTVGIFEPVDIRVGPV